MLQRTSYPYACYVALLKPAARPFRGRRCKALGVGPPNHSCVLDVAVLLLPTRLVLSVVYHGLRAYASLRRFILEMRGICCRDELELGRTIALSSSSLPLSISGGFRSGSENIWTGLEQQYPA